MMKKLIYDFNIRRYIVVFILVFIPFMYQNTDTVDKVVSTVHDFVFAKSFAAGLEKDTAPHMNGRRNILATFPICDWTSLMLVIAGVATTMISIIVIAATGVGVPVALAMAAGLAGVMVGLDDLTKCVSAMVWHPVYHDDDGNMLTCKGGMRLIADGSDKGDVGDGMTGVDVSDKYDYLDDVYSCDAGPSGITAVISEYSWPENAAPYSDYAIFCTLSIQPLPFVSGWGACDRSDYDECYTRRQREFIMNLYNQNSESVNVFDYKKIFLMPDNTKKNPYPHCHTLKSGQKYKSYYARNEGSQVCILHKRMLGGSDYIGCHPRNPSPPQPLCSTSVAIRDSNGKVLGYDDSTCHPCYLSRYCAGAIPPFLKTTYPILSIVIPCIQETFAMVIEGCDNKEGLLLTFTRYMRNSISFIVILSLTLLGYKVLLGVIKASDFAVYVLKVAFIYYLIFSDVLSGYYKGLVVMSNEIAGIVFSAASYQPENGEGDPICRLGPEDDSYIILEPRSIKVGLTPAEQEIYNQFAYMGINTIEELENNTSLGMDEATLNGLSSKLVERNYSYVRMWDQLDCRVGFYLGNTVQTSQTGGDSKGIFGYVFSIVVVIVAHLLPPTGILIGLILIVFLAFLLGMILMFAETYILSFIGLTLAVTFAPIFLPMMLFQATKQYFDEWLKIIIAYSLYPIILFSYLALVMIVLDKLYFGELQFKENKQSVMNPNGGRIIYNYFLHKITADGSEQGITQCQDYWDNMNQGQVDDTGSANYVDSVYPVACIINVATFSDKNLFLGIIVSTWEQFIIIPYSVRLLTLARFAFVLFLFNAFLSIVGHIAAELAGTARVDVSKYAFLGSKVKAAPEKLAKKLAGAAGKFANKATGGKAGAAMNKIKGNIKSGGDKGGNDKGGGTTSRSGGQQGGGSSGRSS